MVLDDVDLVRNLSLLQGLGEISSLGSREGIKVVLELLLDVSLGRSSRFVSAAVVVQRLNIIVRVDGEVDGAPVGAEEYGSGADVEEDDGVSGTEIVVDRPTDGVGTLVGEVDGDADLAAGSGSRGRRGGGEGGGRRGGVVAWGSWVVDSDSGKLWV